MPENRRGGSHHVVCEILHNQVSIQGISTFSLHPSAADQNDRTTIGLGPPLTDRPQITPAQFPPLARGSLFCG
jgi:hypothetical protein